MRFLLRPIGLVAAIWSGAAQAAEIEEPPSIKPLFKAIVLLGAQLRYCDLPADQINRQRADEMVENAFDKLQTALIARAVTLGVAQDTASRSVANFLKRQRRNLTDAQQKQLKCPDDFRPILKTLGSDGFTEHLQLYARSQPHYDRPFTLPGTTLETFAGPSTQKRLILTIHNSMNSCPDMNIKAITLIDKDVGSGERLPVFVKPRIIYTERWTAKCAGKTRAFTVKHTRDSEGPLGHYSVQPFDG